MVLWYIDDVTISGCCNGISGDIDSQNGADVTDLSFMVSYLMGDILSVPCPSAMRIDNDNVVDIGDLSAFVNYLTGGGYTLTSCH
jgi:hypothetical protein